MPDRLNPSVFQLPIEKIQSGWYSDQYFNLTRDLLLHDGYNPVVTMQAFQRKDSVCGGIDEAVAILKLCSGYRSSEVVPSGYLGWDKTNQLRIKRDGHYWVDGWNQLEVKALHEGDIIEPWEPVLQIKGPYALFAHLETVYLGTLARRSLVMSNVRRAMEAANGKPLFFFPARHDHWLVQTGDGLAANTAGVAGVSTDAGASWWGGRGMGTIPHSLIAAYGGDTVTAAQKFADRYAADMNVTVLVDFDNNSVRTALKVAEALGDKLWGVRLDTGGNLIDESILTDADYGSFPPCGVNPHLVHNVRDALDLEGFNDVKIVVSGGFTHDKITQFESAAVPVDAYGVGSSLIRGSNDYTADIVEVDGAPISKVGRWKRPDDRLEVVQ